MMSTFGSDVPRYRIDLVDYASSIGTGIATIPIVLLSVIATVIIVEFSRVSLQDAAERCVARLAHVAPLCVCLCVKLQEGH